MKKILFILAILMVTVVFNSCEETTKDVAPELPPLGSMKLDFTALNPDNEQALVTDDLVQYLKSAEDVNTQLNYFYAGTTVAFWNIILTVNLVVPVASFAAAFNHEPKFLGNAKWEWAYNVNTIGGTYSARMTGEIRNEDVKWEMYLSKSGVNAFDEFMWFDGSSDLDGLGGQWDLYHSPNHQVKLLNINWSKETGGDVAEITYTYVQEEKENGTNDPANGAYIKYGRSNGEYNAYYQVHSYNNNKNNFQDTDIEWNVTDLYGRIRAQHIYGNTDWQCWDENQDDVDCTE